MVKSELECDTLQDDYVSFNTTCICHHPDHNLSISVSKEDDILEISFYFKTMWTDCNQYTYRHTNSVWKKFYYTVRDYITRYQLRIKAALRILWTGGLAVDDYFVFRSPEHFEAITTALNDAVKHVKEHSHAAHEVKPKDAEDS